MPEVLMEARKVNGIGYSVACWPLNPSQSSIVFIHGAAGSGDFWQAQVKGLAGRVNTLAVDLPGHGQSDGAGKDTDPKVIEHFLEETERCDPQVTLADFVACNGFDVMQHIESITLPVLIVSAEDDQLTPTKFGEFLKNSIPGARGAYILDAGHILPMEKPEAFNSAVKKFLDLENL
jgi:pimeloyl-ACP methyl ester carboxylesterase